MYQRGISDQYNGVPLPKNGWLSAAVATFLTLPENNNDLGGAEISAFCTLFGVGIEANANKGISFLKKAMRANSDAILPLVAKQQKRLRDEMEKELNAIPISPLVSILPTDEATLVEKAFQPNVFADLVNPQSDKEYRNHTDELLMSLRAKVNNASEKLNPDLMLKIAAQHFEYFSYLHQTNKETLANYQTAVIRNLAIRVGNQTIADLAIDVLLVLKDGLAAPCSRRRGFP